MTHLEEFTVAFRGYKPCQFDGQTYYRLTFSREGKVYSCKSATNESGKAGTVQFLKGGEIINGQKVVQDCFTLKEITSASIIKSSKEAVAELSEG